MILHLKLYQINLMLVQIAAWNIKGMCNSIIQKEIRKLIRSNSISICGVIVTQLRKKIVESVCNGVFTGWKWVSNSDLSKKGL